MSRNSQKFNPQKKAESDPPQKNQAPPSEDPRVSNNPFGLSFVVPTQDVLLPSEGKYYPVSSPFHQIKSVEIKHMTSKEEDILSAITNPADNLKIYDKLVDSLIIDKKFKAEDLLEEDKLAVILSARITGYGEEFTSEVYCPNCRKVTKHTFDLTKTSFRDPDFIADYDPEENVFFSKLPKSNIDVKILPLTEKVKEDLEAERKQKEKYNLPHNATTATISKVIISANGVTDRAEISKLSEILPAKDAKYIMEFSNSVRPTLSTRQEVECSVCKNTTEQEAPITWAFFRTEF